MSVLSAELRKELEDACVRGRRASESACRAALGSLGVADKQVPGHLGEADRVLRRGLRAKSRQLGDSDGDLELLVTDCAYEQWHRLLFALFLAENGLLIHPEYRAPVSLADCEELAEDLGEPDGWAVAGRFAAEILPGIFRLDDPAVQLRLAPEGRLELERIIARLPTEVFTANDALGWVYQFWQKEKKDEVNASERKIGGADLGPVTQLFTENYMVRFLLENSLGAWWAARHPNSPLVKDWEYLRFDDNGAPAAGTFDGWPDRVAEVTVMDPCCGSGHFLVEAFNMLWQMRAEEEALKPTAAQDSVLRDNLFGLELDPRCVQIAMFSLAMAAWKSGGKWRQLPVPNIACSGIPVKSPVEEWQSLADDDTQVENALVRLHTLFRDADTIGSLINPRRTIGDTDSLGFQQSLADLKWGDLAPLLEQASNDEANDPAAAVLGSNAANLARVAHMLSRRYCLVATNFPFLSRTKQSDALINLANIRHTEARNDLSTIFLDRSLDLLNEHGIIACVSPQNWTFLARYEAYRINMVMNQTIHLMASLGAGAFGQISGHHVRALLLVLGNTLPREEQSLAYLNIPDDSGPDLKRATLINAALHHTQQSAFRAIPDCRFIPELARPNSPMSAVANAWQGIGSSDTPRFTRFFWETPAICNGWIRQQSRVTTTSPFSGRELMLFWEDGQGEMTEVCQEGAPFRGKAAWGKRGVAVTKIGDLPVTLYTGEKFDANAHMLVPKDQADLPALWAFCQSDEFVHLARLLDTSLAITNATLNRVPFDIAYWRRIAEEQYPAGLPEPISNDPTQWLYEGRPDTATNPLQVAVGRLLGYQWPKQLESDALNEVADDDGIVCVPSVLGERTATDRLQELLTRAFGGAWSPARTRELLEASGSTTKNLESWLRDDFFKAHCKLFKHRPFIWHVWDGRKDGFSALVNYHCLDRPTLERLTYTYLGDWIERQTAGVRDEVAGAEERLAAARNLQGRLELILEGVPPYDIYVRWKSLAEQPMGWEPDLNDGVRLNVRPFVEAGVLRSKFNVKWTKDRGKNPDGSERHNDLHFSLAEKQAARQDAAT